VRTKVDIFDYITSLKNVKKLKKVATGIDFASFYDYSFGCWNCSDGVVCFVFHFIENNHIQANLK
jgi:hypothetical protein